MKVLLFLILPSLAMSLPVEKAGIKNYVRGCYFTNWAQYRWGRAKFSPSNYEPGLCTHIFYAFAYVDSNWKPIPSDPTDLGDNGQYNQVNNLKKTDPNLKTLLSFGGASFSSWTFSQLVASAANRKAFIDSTIPYLRQYNFDGIDIDWEYPGAWEKDSYTALIKELKQAVVNEAQSSGKPRLLITAATPAGVDNVGGIDLPNLKDDFDFLNVMTYDFHGSWESVTGFNSPLFNRIGETAYQQRLNTAYVANFYASQGFPKEKIIVGIASYGRGWTLTYAGNNGVGATASGTSTAFTFTQTAGIGSYFEICEVVASGGNRVFDDQAKVPYVVKGNQWIGYDDAESVQAKCNWIKANNFGGAFVWTIDFDDFNGKCPNSGGKNYPIIKTIKNILV